VGRVSVCGARTEPIDGSGAEATEHWTEREITSPDLERAGVDAIGRSLIFRI